jgi:hypothetical protein
MPFLAAEGEARERKASGRNPRPVVEQVLRYLARNLLSRNSEAISLGVRVRSAILAMSWKSMWIYQPPSKVLVQQDAEEPV